MKQIFMILLAAFWIGGCTGMPTQPGGTTQIDETTITAIPMKGDSGENVRKVQVALNKKGASLTPDGEFGGVTEKAVSKLQKENGLEGSGVIGPKTLEILGLKLAEAPVVTEPSNPTEPSGPTTPGEASFDKKYPSSGWHSDFDDYVESKATAAMISMSTERMAKVCPQWGSMNEEKRREFWADMIFATIKPESNYKWASMYWETTQGTDSVTGLNVKTSEGPLQLSYSDIGITPECDFKYQEHDKPYHVKDIAARPSSAKSWNSAYPQEKYILHPVRNIHCGMAIMDKMLRNSNLASWEFADLMGRYWAVWQRSKNPESFAQIVKGMKSRGSVCTMQ